MCAFSRQVKFFFAKPAGFKRLPCLIYEKIWNIELSEYPHVDAGLAKKEVHLKIRVA